MLVPILKQKRTKRLNSVNVKAPPVESLQQQSALILRSMSNNAKSKWLPKEIQHISRSCSLSITQPFTETLSQRVQRKLHNHKKNDKIKIGNLTWSYNVLTISKPGKHTGPQKQAYQYVLASPCGSRLQQPRKTRFFPL
jgi:hypothetical protein